MIPDIYRLVFAAVIAVFIAAAMTGCDKEDDNANLTYGSMTDQDGNIYATIVIGTQEWMAENLRARTYRNGDLIPQIGHGAYPWTVLTTGAYSWYLCDGQYENPYGKLYNWYAVNDPRNLCPVGWHVPSDAEWNTLVKHLDPNADIANNVNNAGTGMKSTTWQYGLGSNESGFSGLAGGWRASSGSSFSGLGGEGRWWSSTEYWSTSAGYRILNSSSISSKSVTLKTHGFSVRCLRD